MQRKLEKEKHFPENFQGVCFSKLEKPTDSMLGLFEKSLGFKNVKIICVHVAN